MKRMIATDKIAIKTSEITVSARKAEKKILPFLIIPFFILKDVTNPVKLNINGIW